MNKIIEIIEKFFQGSGGSAQEGDLCKQGVQGVQDPQLHTLQDCEEGGDRTCPTFQCCCYNLESGEQYFSIVTYFQCFHFKDDLNTALEAIRGGMPVQKAATEFGIPSGTLYGRCKKVGIELSKNTQVWIVKIIFERFQRKIFQVHWSEDDMMMALDSVRTGNMSINQVTYFSCEIFSVFYEIFSFVLVLIRLVSQCFVVSSSGKLKPPF